MNWKEENDLSRASEINCVCVGNESTEMNNYKKNIHLLEIFFY